MKPVIYLDVDGVLNAIPFKINKLRKAGWSDWQKSNVPSPIKGDDRVFPFWTSKEMGAALLSLNCDIEWLTTWGEEADTHIADLVGLPKGLPVTSTIDTYRDTRPSSGLFVVNSFNWKLEGILTDQEKNPRPFIWIDDDAIDFAAETYLKENCGDTPWHLVKTAAHMGLSKFDVDGIRKFLKTLEDE